MTIQEQIAKKQKQISDLEYEIYRLRVDNISELIKPYQKYVGKYYELDKKQYVKVINVKNEKIFNCLFVDYDEECNTICVDGNDQQSLFRLNNATEITEKEFMEFINTHINKITKGE